MPGEEEEGDRSRAQPGLALPPLPAQSGLDSRSVNMGTSKHIAVICASNLNRSMETHHLFVERGVPNVSSYGTGSQVKLPGPTRNQPNVYDFGTPYQEIFNDLSEKDRDLYANFCLAPSRFGSPSRTSNSASLNQD